MKLRLIITVLLAGALLGVVALFTWLPRPASVTHASHNLKADAPPTEVMASASTASTESTAATQLMPTAQNRRAEFHRSRNYAEFVRTLASGAAAGDPIAEYLTAKALKYCRDNRHYVVNADGSLRTRDELEVRSGRFGTSLQQQILDGYDRCHEFFDTPSQPNATSEWEAWLEKSAAAGYPPAQSLKADVSRQADLMQDVANASGGDLTPPTAGPARDLALQAVLSGDPDSIFEMQNWVDGTKRSLEDSETLMGAWQLLACQRGYDDCGAQSEWLRSMCGWDPQCADDNSVTDTLKREFGTHFDDVQNLADDIGHAIDQKDLKTVETYL